MKLRRSDDSPAVSADPEIVDIASPEVQCRVHDVVQAGAGADRSRAR